MSAAATDWDSEPIEVVSLARACRGGWDRGVTSVHVDPDCGMGPSLVVDRWWGTLADLDCVTCRVAARCQILRRREGRLA